MSDRQPAEDRVLILAPAGRDALLAAAALQKWDMEGVVCPDAETFCAEIEAGAAVGVITQEALATARDGLLRTLERQPLWSDFPLIVLAARPPTAAGRQRLAEALAALGNVTLIDRPLHAEALASGVRSARRARDRQYQARELLRRLEQGVRERDHFLAMLGHELRNPLGAINNAMHLLSRGLPADSAHLRPMAVVDRQTRHLTKLVDDLLDVSRVTTGKIVLKRSLLDLRGILGDALQQLEPALASSGLTLVTSIPDKALPVDGDPVRLEQVFTNLLTNAVKYTPRGGRVTVTAEIDGEVVRVRIADTGVGIPADALPDIFNLFAQSEQSLARSQGGMGIGLTLVRNLVDLHGGSVTARSEGPGQGSAFTVTLKLAAGVPQPSTAVERNGPPIARRILVVDDNADNRDSLQDLLRFEGHQVDAVADGPQAVSHALALGAEVAIVDIGLPGMDGFEVARRLRAALGPHLLLIALTGYGQPEDRTRTAAAGFDAHVTKPADLPELRQIISRRTAA
jgi:signal transduction histidine kinase